MWGSEPSSLFRLLVSLWIIQDSRTLPAGPWHSHGIPVSVVVADLVMEDVESRALATFPYPLRFWKRYVDDTCCAFKTDLVEDFHCHLNSIAP